MKLNKNKVSFMEIGWERTTFLYYENKKLVHFVGTGTGGYKTKLEYLSELFKHIKKK